MATIASSKEKMPFVEQSFRFFDLPTELRLKIYEAILYPSDRCATLLWPRYWSEDYQDLPLLEVCQQMRQEVRGLLLKNYFCLDLRPGLPDREYISCIVELNEIKFLYLKVRTVLLAPARYDYGFLWTLLQRVHPWISKMEALQKVDVSIYGYEHDVRPRKSWDPTPMFEEGLVMMLEVMPPHVQLDVWNRGWKSNVYDSHADRAICGPPIEGQKDEWPRPLRKLRVLDSNDQFYPGAYADPEVVLALLEKNRPSQGKSQPGEFILERPKFKSATQEDVLRRYTQQSYTYP